MNKYKITWSPKARKDLKNIYNYIAYNLGEKNVAKKQITNIIDSISTLETFPQRYLKLFDYNPYSPNVRRLPVNKYVVIYEVNNNTRSSLHFTHLSWQPKLFKIFIILFFHLFR